MGYELLNAKEIAAMLELSTATIRKWVLTGYIPYKKIGRAVRFSASEIQDWARSKHAGAAQPQGQENRGVDK